MTKKRDLEAELVAGGWEKVKRKKGPHDKFTKPGRRSVPVPRHTVIDDDLADEIRKQAGLK